MALSVQSKCASGARAVARTRNVRVEAVHGAVERVQIAAASVLAATLLVSPAYAGVQITQPTLKKVFIDDAPPRVRGAPAPKSESSGFSLPSLPGLGGAPSPIAAPAPKKVLEPTSDMGLDPRAIALPGALAFVGGLAVVASKVDEGFGEFMDNTLIKDNNVGQSGVGYEQVLKSTYGGIWGEPTAAGTKKVKAAKKK